MNTALTIIGLAMFIFIVVFSLKRAKEKKSKVLVLNLHFLNFINILELKF